MKSTPLAISAAVGLGLFLQPGLAGAAQGDKTAEAPKAIFLGASTAIKFDISPPLRSMKPLQAVEEHPEREDRPSGREGPLGPQTPDTVVQNRVGPGRIPAPLVSFDGFSGLGPTPPDPNGDVGPNHYVAMANTRFAVYSKTGTLMFGPANINTLWAGFGGNCQTNNSGDPVVIYDQLDDRWILTQFTASAAPFNNCVAVSTTPDPTGTYFRYAFMTPLGTGANFPDYPKYGMWSDALYISTREFNSAGTAFLGIGAYAINRAQLIAGNPAAVAIGFLAPPGGTMYNVGDGLLPSDLDGNAPPPAGEPNFYLGTMDSGGPYGAPQDAITLYKFHADFVTPANSTFTLTNTLPVAAFSSTFPCSPGARDCIPQPATAQKIDILSYRQRPVFRGAYRNYGTHESIVTNQSVDAGTGMAGIRWYEIRDPNGTPVIFQQSTYAPGLTDGIHRWMGSIAMDNSGNMALGYSTSNGTAPNFPSSKYTGRLSGDPVGTMPQGEGSFIDGTGSQTASPRWGDYTDMTIDPTDNCRFWYINEYYPVSSGTAWRLRIGSFNFPSCVPTPVELQKFDIE